MGTTKRTNKMGRRRSGGFGAPPPGNRGRFGGAPPPARQQQQSGGSLVGGLAGMIYQGFGWGVGSSLGRAATASLLGSSGARVTPRKAYRRQKRRNNRTRARRRRRRSASASQTLQTTWPSASRTPTC